MELSNFQHVSLAYIAVDLLFCLFQPRDKQLTGQVCLQDMCEGSRIFHVFSFREHVYKHRSIHRRALFKENFHFDMFGLS